MPYDPIKNPWHNGGSVDSLTGRMARVTPSDTLDLETYGRIVILAAGAVRVLPANSADPADATANETILFGDLPVGYVVPGVIRRVLATGTTATVAVTW